LYAKAVAGKCSHERLLLSMAACADNFAAHTGKVADMDLRRFPR